MMHTLIPLKGSRKILKAQPGGHKFINGGGATMVGTGEAKKMTPSRLA